MNLCLQYGEVRAPSVCNFVSESASVADLRFIQDDRAAPASVAALYERRII